MVVVPGLAGAWAVHAQVLPPQTEVTLDPVAVTATRGTERLFDVPASAHFGTTGLAPRTIRSSTEICSSPGPYTLPGRQIVQAPRYWRTIDSASRLERW